MTTIPSRSRKPKYVPTQEHLEDIQILSEEIIKEAEIQGLECDDLDEWISLINEKLHVKLRERDHSQAIHLETIIVTGPRELIEHVDLDKEITDIIRRGLKERGFSWG